MSVWSELSIDKWQLFTHSSSKVLYLGSLLANFILPASPSHVADACAQVSWVLIYYWRWSSPFGTSWPQVPMPCRTIPPYVCHSRITSVALRCTTLLSIHSSNLNSPWKISRSWLCEKRLFAVVWTPPLCKIVHLARDNSRQHSIVQGLYKLFFLFSYHW